MGGLCSAHGYVDILRPVMDDDDDDGDVVTTSSTLHHLLRMQP